MTTLVTAPPTIRTLADLLERLGGVSPDRIRFYPSPGTATEADVLAIEAHEDRLCELVDGTLVEKPMSYRESVLACFLLQLLQDFVKARNLGLVSGEAGMMRLVPGQVRIPDIAFASWDRFPDRRVPTEPIPDLVPDLAVEVLSPSNTVEEMARKRREYFAAGTHLVWEIDPAARTVAVYTTPDAPTVLNQSRTLDGGTVLPGFTLPLRDLFAELDRHGGK